MLVLLETAAGFGLFKVSDKKISSDPAKLYEAFADVTSASKV
jgi:hypothetical protein